MLVRNNPSKAVPALLDRLSRTIEFHQARSAATSSSADDDGDIHKIRSELHSLMKRFPTFVEWEKQLLDQLVELNCCNQKIITSNLRSVLQELEHANELLLYNHVSTSNITHPNQTSTIHTLENQHGFKSLSSLEKKIMTNLDNNNEVVRSLRVSYDLIEPIELKICFLFMAIFPENAVLKKRLLIYWWIGEGLVHNEIDGEEKFGKLLELGLIMPHRSDKRPKSTVNKCKIHPWMRYMLLSVAKEETLLQIDRKGLPRFDRSDFRHLFLIEKVPDEETGEYTRAETKYENLEVTTFRTFFNVDMKDLRFSRQWLAKQKRLKVLQLGRWQVSPTYHITVRGDWLLTGLKSQKHLTYLSLRGVLKITSLPDSVIKKLVSLQILDLKACHSLKALPEAISSLKGLTHLDVSECYLLESLPKGLENLTSLKVLKGFLIGNSRDNHFMVKQLEKLDKLERLSVHIGNGADILYNEFKVLEDLKQLRCLKIFWGVLRKDLQFSFPPELKKLDLVGFPHEDMPYWLSPTKLSKLEKLYIKGGILSDIKGKWKNMKTLILKYTKELKTQEDDILHQFPSLEYVKKVNWEEGDKTSETLGKESIEFEWTSME